MSTLKDFVKFEVERLNEKFYKSFDAEYFHQKCLYLVGILNNPKIISDSLSNGAKFKSLSIEWDDQDDSPDARRG